MQMVTLNKDDIYQGPLVLVNHNYPLQITIKLLTVRLPRIQQYH